MANSRYLKGQREGYKNATDDFKASGTEGIKTKPSKIESLLGKKESDAEYQGAKEMKKALESERALRLDEAKAERNRKMDTWQGKNKAAMEKAYKDNARERVNGHVWAADVDPEGRDKVFDNPLLTNKENTSMKKGGSVSSASKRADGCAVRGKTRA